MGGNDDSDDSDGNDIDGSMMIDSPANNEAPAKDMEDDGWVPVVSRKKSKGRKK